MTAIQLDYTSRPWTWGGWPTRDQSVQSRNEFITADQLEYLIGCLGDIPFLIDDLEIAELKQDRFLNPPVGADPEESTIPFRTAPATISRQLATTILSAADLVWHKAAHGQPSPFRNAVDAAEFLADNPRLIAREPEAESIGAHIARTHDSLIADYSVLDRPAWEYLGLCPDCQQSDLWARPDQTWVGCECGWTGDTSRLKDQLLDAAKDRLFTDTELTRLLWCDGRPVTRDQINGWARRGRLAVYNSAQWCDGHLRSVRKFRYSEAYALVADAERRAQTRREQRGRRVGEL